MGTAWFEKFGGTLPGRTPLSATMRFHFSSMVCGDLDNLIGGVMDAHVILNGQKVNILPSDKYVHEIYAQKVFTDGVQGVEVIFEEI